MGTPRLAGPGFIRSILTSWYTAPLASATVAPDFAAATLVTSFGGSAGYAVPFWCEVERLRFTVGSTDFAGASGTLTFVLRKGSATGTTLATLTIPLASALRGTVLEATVAASADGDGKLKPGDLLFITRTATGTAFTTGEGTWDILVRQRLQSKGV